MIYLEESQLLYEMPLKRYNKLRFSIFVIPSLCSLMIVYLIYHTLKDKIILASIFLIILQLIIVLYTIYLYIRFDRFKIFTNGFIHFPKPLSIIKKKEHFFIPFSLIQYWYIYDHSKDSLNASEFEYRIKLKNKISRLDYDISYYDLVLPKEAFNILKSELKRNCEYKK